MENSTNISNEVKQNNSKNKNILGLIGFIISICSIPSFGLLSIFGLALSIVGLIESKRFNNDKRILSILGIIISSIMLTVLVVIAVNDNYSNIQNSNDDVTPVEKEDKKIKVEVQDFSNMSKEDITKWCDDNSIVCSFVDEYSNAVITGGFISQSVSANKKISEGSSITIKYSKGPKPTLSQLNAVATAKSYLNSMAFSYKGLIEQLEYEKYPHEDAVYGVDNCGADWNEQAVKMAASYLNSMTFSHAGLVEQLEYEGFTHEQAEYGVSKNGL